MWVSVGKCGHESQDGNYRADELAGMCIDPDFSSQDMCVLEGLPDAMPVVHRCASSHVWNDEQIAGEEHGGASVTLTAGAGSLRGGGGQVLLDSGASDCMTGDESFISGKLQPLRIPITCAKKGSGMETAGVGRGCVRVGGGDITVPTMYFVPGMDMTLISVASLQGAGYGIYFPPHKAYVRISKGGSTVQVQRINGLYPLAGDASVVSALTTRVRRQIVNNTHVGGLGAAELLHQRLGHVSWSNKFLSSEISKVFGADVAGATKALCTSCVESKLRQVYSRLPPRRPATRPLERVHFDISPKIPVPGARGEVGFMLLVDEFTSKYFI